MHDDGLDLLLAFDDGPAGSLPRGALADRPPAAGADELPAHLWADNDDIDDLALQRWCVVVPEGPRGERLRRLVEPLVRRREGEQRAAVATYPVPERMSESEAQSWLARLRASFPRARDAPRYFLLLGDLDEVPLAVQQAIALADGCPGRLAFEREDDLVLYVSRVMREETAQPRPTVALHAAGSDRTIDHARANLLAPLHEQLRRGFELGELPVSAITGLSDLGALPGLARPILFTVSHGYAGDRALGFASPEQRRREQGALVLGGGVRLGPADVGARPFAQDGLWFMFACYGAGTPDHSVYAPWLRELHDGRLAHLADLSLRALPGPGERPFVAALPRAALANPAGPLACIGHVDIAWQYAYSDADPTVPSRPGKFAALIEDACRGHRAGALIRSLARAAADAALRLTAEAGQARRDPSLLARRRDRVAHLWLLHHDLAAYILLGDPAVRLRGPAAKASAAASTPAPAIDPGLATIARRLGPAALEEAMAHALIDEPARKVAARLGIALADLRALEEAYRRAGRRALGLDE